MMKNLHTLERFSKHGALSSRHYFGERQNGATTTMLWVDYQDYYGPDRRRASAVLRLRERRRENYAGAPPALNVALRQLRMHAIEACGAELRRFASRVKAIAMLAAETGFFEASGELSALSARLCGPCGADPRNEIYEAIRRAEAALQPFH